MSKFPNPQEFSLTQSHTHFKQLPKTPYTFIIKKANGVYLYDIDSNKYTDFSLDNGNIYSEHSPSRLSKFIKNALSSGFNCVNHPNKFLFKAQKNWQNITILPHIGFYSSFTDMILSIFNTLPQKKEICIAYNTNFLYKQLQEFKNLVNLQPCNPLKSYENIDILLWEEFNDDFSTFTLPQDRPNICIQQHSRYLFRHDKKKEYSFHKDLSHFIYCTPFGGKHIGVLASANPISYHVPSFDNGILFLEGAKYYLTLKNKTNIYFSHPNFSSYHGFAVCKEYLDPSFFLQRGIYLHNNMLFFSPLHTEHDLRRLKKALEEYFIHK